MKRLIENTVFSGLVTACRFAPGPPAVPGLGERDDRRRQPSAFGVGDHHGFAAFHDRDDGVGGAQIDADDFAHDDLSSLIARSPTGLISL
jgi:NAD-specific glutamate dehydrogenase.